MHKWFTPFVISIVFFSLTLSAANPTVFHCWDLSFFMKYANMVETDNRFEVRVTGSGLGPASFTRYDEVINIDHLYGKKEIYVPFKKDECEIAPDGLSGHCEKAGNILWESFFIAREIDHLWDKVSTITGMPSTYISMDFNPDHFALTIQGAFDPEPQTIQFNLGQCYDRNLDSPEFPEALKDFLNKYYP